MRSRSGIMALLALGSFGCGGGRPASEPRVAPPASHDVSDTPPSAPSALRFEPPIGTAYVFERTTRTVGRHETTEHVAHGTWTPTSARESALHVESNGQEWSHAADVVLHFDARGLVTDSPDDLRNLPELDGMALTLAPIGSSGVALPLEASGGELRGVVSLAALAPAGFPSELPVVCALEESQGERTLSCSGTFASPPTERHPGWLTSLSYRVEIHATLDAHGVAWRSVQHVASDITQQQLDHVEHEGGESTITTVLRLP